MWQGKRYDIGVPHAAWGVTLKHKGGKFILDLSSAQFGFYEPVALYDDYMMERVERIIRIKDIRQDNLAGTQLFFTWNALQHCEDDFQAGWMPLTRSLTKKLSCWLWESIKGWEKKNISISELLNSRPEEFEKKTNQLAEHVDANFVIQSKISSRSARNERRS